MEIILTDLFLYHGSQNPQLNGHLFPNGEILEGMDALMLVHNRTDAQRGIEVRVNDLLYDIRLPGSTRSDKHRPNIEEIFYSTKQRLVVTMRDPRDFALSYNDWSRINATLPGSLRVGSTTTLENFVKALHRAEDRQQEPQVFLWNYGIGLSFFDTYMGQLSDFVGLPCARQCLDYVNRHSSIEHMSKL